MWSQPATARQIAALKSTGNKDALNAIGRQVAMHIAATAPLAIRSEEVDAVVAERERNVFIEQSRESGKPEAIIEKMVGRAASDLYARPSQRHEAGQVRLKVRGLRTVRNPDAPHAIVLNGVDLDLKAGETEGVSVFWDETAPDGAIKDSRFAKAGIDLYRLPGTTSGDASAPVSTLL